MLTHVLVVTSYIVLEFSHADDTKCTSLLQYRRSLKMHSNSSKVASSAKKKDDAVNMARQPEDEDMYEAEDSNSLLKSFRDYPVVSRFAASLFAMLFVLTIAHGLNGFEKEDHAREEIEERRSEPLAENTYMMAVASLVRDLHRVSHGTGVVGLRSTRILVSLALLFLTIFIQVSSLVCIKLYVTPQSVSNIRDVYDKYELIMYGRSLNHTIVTSNGYHRGITQYFRPERFKTLDDDMKSEVCNIPFAQVFFLELVLFIWALTCMAQFKHCAESFHSLVVVTPTITRMDEALIPDTSSDGQLLVGLTIGLKLFLLFLVYSPWLCTTGFLLWLGSRWLTATNDYGEVVLNGVALEFILQLKELLYLAMISERSKRDLRNLSCSPPWKQEKAGYAVFLNGVVWGYLAILWVWFYVYYFQSVLPDYKWDVRAVCSSWLAELS